MGVVPLVVGKAKPQIGIHGVEPAILERISAKLVGEADRSESALAAQVQALGTDRSRLASELDGAAARSRELESTNREIAQRLDVAIESIRAVIET